MTDDDEPETDGSPQDSTDEKEDDDFDSSDTDSGQIQTVSLPGGLTSSIPLEFDEWEWSTSGMNTTITHRGAGQTRPDAIIYAQQFGPLINVAPTREIQAFMISVDPGFTPFLEILNALDGLDEIADELSGAQNQQANAATEKSNTVGDYRSSPGTFTGWKWLGQNEYNVEFRLGRTFGQWLDDEASSSNDSSANRLNDDPQSDENSREQTTRAASAWMIIGSARTQSDSGTHLAILCKTAPDCPVSADIATFLANFGAP